MTFLAREGSIVARARDERLICHWLFRVFRTCNCTSVPERTPMNRIDALPIDGPRAHAKGASSAAAVHPSLPGWMRAINMLGRSGRRLGLGRRHLDPDRLMDIARRWEGLGDFGEDHFVEPLRRILAEARERAEITPVGRLILRRACLRALAGRLRVREVLRLHPEIARVPLPRPLIITGLPRSGTTLLHNVMSQDPGGRPLYFWETFRVCPSWRASVRHQVLDAQRKIDAAYRLAPRLAQAHPMAALGPAECNGLFEYSFTTELVAIRLPLPDYADWLRGHDWSAAYREYRVMLQLLAWQHPGTGRVGREVLRGDGHAATGDWAVRDTDRMAGARWVLKCPLHIAHLDILLNTFPDACIVQTHRDPLEVAPSLCSLTEIFHSISIDPVDRGEIGRAVSRSLAAMTRAERAARAVRAPTPAPAAAPSDCILDIPYRALVRDPVATAAHVCERFGIDFTPPFESGVRQWLGRNPQHKRGVNRYTLEQYGLKAADIEEQFAPYRARLTGLDQHEPYAHGDTCAPRR